MTSESAVDFQVLAEGSRISAATRCCAVAGRSRALSALWLLPILCLPSDATWAHSFVTVYNLPVPFWMYAYGATAALVVSFVLVAYFAGAPAAITAGLAD